MDEQLFQQKLRSTLLPAWEQLPDFGLYMDQVMTYAEKCFAGVAEAEQKLMTPAMMNNYVKGGAGGSSRGQEIQSGQPCTAADAVSAEIHHVHGYAENAAHPADSTTQEAVCVLPSGTGEDRGLPLLAPPDPIACALESSSYQYVCKLLLQERKADGKEE